MVYHRLSGANFNLSGQTLTKVSWKKSENIFLTKKKPSTVVLYSSPSEEILSSFDVSDSSSIYSEYFSSRHCRFQAVPPLNYTCKIVLIGLWSLSSDTNV